MSQSVVGLVHQKRNVPLGTRFTATTGAVGVVLHMLEAHEGMGAHGTT